MDPGHHVTLELLELGNYTSSLLYMGRMVCPVRLHVAGSSDLTFPD